MASQPIRTELYLNPVGFTAGPARDAALAAGASRPLGGGWVTFSAVETVTGATAQLGHASLEEAERLYPAEMEALTAPKPDFAGMSLDRPRILGIVNVTPDSFSDGGDFADPAHAIDRAFALAEAGADMIDVGGESTRPGSDPTPVDAEIARVVPVISACAKAGLAVSVDTRRAPVMRAAIDAGARVVNDITAFTDEAASLETVAASDASVILMHMQGTPGTMQANPVYTLASRDICAWLASRVAACEAAGIPKSRICIDPGIGFGKTDIHNMEILARAGMFHMTGCAVLFGVSRKSFIGRIAGVPDPKSRLPGTIAATAIALARGVQLHRVHDVAEARQALAIFAALEAGTAAAGDNG